MNTATPRARALSLILGGLGVVTLLLLLCEGTRGVEESPELVDGSEFIPPSSSGSSLSEESERGDLRVDAGGDAGKSIQNSPFADAPGARTIRVKVSDEQGMALEGVLVGPAGDIRDPFKLLDSKAVATDPKGMARLPLEHFVEAKAQGVVRGLRAIKPGFAPNRVEFSPGTAVVSVVLAHGGSAIVRCIDASGLEVPKDIRVDVIGMPEMLSAEFRKSCHSADPELGTFRIDGLPLELTWLAVTSPGYAPRMIEVVPSLPPAQRVVQLQPTSTLRVRVTDLAGVPVKEAEVRLWAHGERAGRMGLGPRYPVDSASTGADGAVDLEIGRSEELRYAVEIAAGGFRHHSQELDSSVVTAGLPAIQLRRTATVEIRVVDEQGNPIEAVVAALDLSQLEIKTRSGQLELARRTNSMGSLTWETAPAGLPLGLRVQAGLHVTDSILASRELAPLEPSSVTQLELQVQGWHPLRGSLSRSGWPVGGKVSAPPTDFSPRPTSLSVGPDGTFSTWLRAGTHRLAVSTGTSKIVRELHMEGPRAERFEFEPGRVVRGRLIDAREEPLASRVVTVFNLGGEAIANCGTDQEGRFVLEGLPASAEDLYVCSRFGVYSAFYRGPLDDDLGDIPLREHECVLRFLDHESGEPFTGGFTLEGTSRSPRQWPYRLSGAASDLGVCTLLVPEGSWIVRPFLETGSALPQTIEVGPTSPETSIEVLVAATLTHPWDRPGPARGEGTLQITTRAKGGQVEQTRRLEAAHRTTLHLPPGESWLEFRPDEGGRWAGRIQLDAL